MSNNRNFQQISTKPGFMKHNGGLLFRNKSKTEYEFKSTIKKKHLNAAKITHGGYIAALIDAGAGIVADSKPLKEYEETVNKAKALINALR